MGGPAQQVVPSTNQGRLVPYVPPTTVREWHNYVIRHHKDQKYWLDDQNAEEVCKKFIISKVDEVYLKALWEPRIQYKGKTLQQFLDVLIDDFQATLEEQAAVRALIEAAWDPN